MQEGRHNWAEIKEFSYFPFEYREIVHGDGDAAAAMLINVLAHSSQSDFRLNQQFYWSLL